jgi:hypothetical protein
MSDHDLIQDLIEDLVAANRILSDHGVLDAYGHISARDPGHKDRYWLSRSMAPALVTAADIIAFDFDNNPVDGGNHKLFFERVIHGEVYKARPDVMAVLHNHSPSLIPFCNSDTKLRPMTGNAAFLGEGAPVFDIRDIDDEGDLNICTVAQARGARSGARPACAGAAARSRVGRGRGVGPAGRAPRHHRRNQCQAAAPGDAARTRAFPDHKRDRICQTRGPEGPRPRLAALEEKGDARSGSGLSP